MPTKDAADVLGTLLVATTHSREHPAGLKCMREIFDSPLDQVEPVSLTACTTELMQVTGW